MSEDGDLQSSVDYWSFGEILDQVQSTCIKRPEILLFPNWKQYL